MGRMQKQQGTLICSGGVSVIYDALFIGSPAFSKKSGGTLHSAFRCDRGTQFRISSSYLVPATAPTVLS